MSDKVLNLYQKSYTLALRNVNALSSTLGHVQDAIADLNRTGQGVDAKGLIVNLKQAESELQQKLELAKLKFQRLSRP